MGVCRSFHRWARAAPRSAVAELGVVRPLAPMSKRSEQLESWQRYYSERKDIHETSLEVGSRYDKLVLAVSGGGFALTVTLLDKIVHSPPPVAKLFLCIGWLSFGASIIAQIFAMRYSSRALQLSIEQLDHTYQTESSPPASIPTRTTEITAAIRCVRVFNETGLWGAAAGLLGLVIFASIAIFCSQPTNPTNQNERTKTTDAATNTDSGNTQEGGLRATSTASPAPISKTKQGVGQMSDEPAKPKSEHLSKGSYVPPANALPPPPPPPEPKEEKKADDKKTEGA